MRWEDRAATPERILALVPPAARRRALELALEPPGRADWKRFLEAVLTGLGALVTASGVIYFIAYNWSSLGRFTKFGLVELAIVAAFLVGGRWGLTVAALLIGPLLALYGQTYQLKADTWHLFAGWAALMLPWALAARHTPLWLAFWAVVNTGFWTGLQEQWLLIGALNLVWWVSAEMRGWRWVVYACALMTMACWTFPACGEMLDLKPKEYLLCALLAAGGVLWAYRRVRRDGFLLALACGSVIACVTSGLAGGLVDFDSALGVLTVAALLVAQVSLATWWLRREVAA